MKTFAQRKEKIDAITETMKWFTRPTCKTGFYSEQESIWPTSIIHLQSCDWKMTVISHAKCFICYIQEKEI